MRSEESHKKIKASELQGKTIVDFYNGAGMCNIQDVEFTFDAETGAIQFVLVPQKRFGILGRKKPLQIPWNVIQKIGKEVIIVDMSKII